jgi:D-serine deaminase-like pyridoxal phosphate-dependent protein
VPTLADLQTPLVVIDAPALQHNIARMAEAAAAGGKRLRPHGKTHKSGWIARQQVAAGAIGMTCAKPGEAEVFAAAGIDDIRIAYPISPTYAPRVLSLMDGVRLSTIVDDLGVAQGWSDAMAAAGRRLEVLVKIDVGTHRCGVDPTQRDAIGFIETVSRMPGLDLRGLLSHAGHSYGASSLDHVRDIAGAEAAMMQELVAGCAARGVLLEEVSVGSTPTARLSAGLPGITELRPGNYVFHDRTQVGLGVVEWQDCALRVHASVTSFPAPDRLVLDCGSKVLSSDGARGFAGAATGFGVVLGPDGQPDPGLVIERLSEEHGVVRVTGPTRLRIGDRVTVIPNHACVVANLSNGYTVVEGETVVETQKVEARGLVN